MKDCCTLTPDLFAHRVSSAARHLRLYGVKPGDRIGILSPNSAEYLIVLFALWRCGAVACLLSTRLPEDAVNIQLRKTGCRYLLTCIDALLRSKKIRIKKISFDEIVSGEDMHQVKFGKFRGHVPLVRVPGSVPRGGREATIMFTSGSVGEPKAAVHTFANHYFNALGANERIPVGHSSRWLVSLPLYHVGGLGIIFRVLLGEGAVVFSGAQEDIAEAVIKYRITHVSLVPTQLYRLLYSKKGIMALRRLKAVLLGGGPIPEALVRRAVSAGVPLYVTYGLTEMASQVATSERLTQKDFFPAARVLKHRQLRISPEGEILVKGRTLFKGYLQKDGVVLPLDLKGWFATGDLGRLNADRTLTVLGRKDNMFISGGENIQPEEIERHLCRIEGILQAVVVPVKSEEFGSRPAAFIQTADRRRISQKEITAYLLNNLPKFKVPDVFYRWPENARCKGVKIDRVFLMKTVSQRPAILDVIR